MKQNKLNYILRYLRYFIINLPFIFKYYHNFVVNECKLDIERLTPSIKKFMSFDGSSLSPKTKKEVRKKVYSTDPRFEKQIKDYEKSLI